MATRILISVLAVAALFIGSVWAASPPAGEGSDGSVTFYKDVLPIFQKNCQSCHRSGQIGPFSLMSYQEARPWAKAIKAAVVGRKMPPWFADPKYGHFDNDRSMKQSEIDTIVAWTDSGATEGNPKDAPEP